MKCPVCKKEIKTDVLKCPHCNATIGITCKKCKTVNLLGRKICKNCGSELLKFCPNCKAANYPDALKCRKCGEIFNKEATLDDMLKSEKTDIQSEQKTQSNDSEIEAESNEASANKSMTISQKVRDMQFQNIRKKQAAQNIQKNSDKKKNNSAKLSQNEAKDLIKQALGDINKHVISLIGDRGFGKTLVVKSLLFDLKDTPDMMWLFVECTPLSQLTVGGFLQNLLLSIFNLPAMCINSPQFQKSAYDFIKNNFEKLEDSEIYDLINFLYPNIRGNYEEISENKLKTFAMLEKVFDTITNGVNTVYVIDNFQYADGFSYEFFLRYMKRDIVYNRTKLILTYDKINPVKGKFYLDNRQDQDYTADFILAPLEYKEMLEILVNKKKQNQKVQGLTKQEAHQIWELSHGNPAYLEQTIALKTDCIMANQPFEVSENFEGIVGQRLALLSYLNTQMYNFILTSAILGKKINVALVKEILAIPDEEIQSIIDFLTEHDYIQPYSPIYYEFRSPYLWEAIMANAKLDENFIPANERILSFLKEYTLNTVSVLAIIAQNLKQPNLAMNIWTKIVQFCAYIGDVNLYIIAQKQCIAIINEFDDRETLKIRYNISERLGKLLTDIKPSEAMEYLPDAINNAKMSENLPKEIELLGYMASSCRKVGNYNGEIECADTVIEKNKENLTTLNLVLLKCTKLNALLNIGNCGEVVNTIDTEIMPVLDEFFTVKHDSEDLTVKFVFETWVKTYLVLAKALILQGNNRAFEVLKILYDIIDNNKIEDGPFICKSKLALAFANTLRGDYKASQQVLDDVAREYPTGIMDDESVIEWNFIDILNKFFLKRYQGMQENLFKVVTFANNNGDNFTKNVLKVLLGKMFKDTGNIEKAIEIYNEQIVYFAKEKMAFGALLTWFMIADVTLIKEGAKNAINIANQALEVAQNPKIQNFFFEVLLKIILAKSFMALEDFDSAQININEGIKIAQAFDMQDLLCRLYILNGDCYRELGLVTSQKQKQYINNAKKMYNEALELSKITMNSDIYQQITSALDDLNEFCKHNKL